ncbi:MAG: hypothetical protein KC478_17425, partial [Bacteriovoracaceae bacterium]|nr:hypothetical protein [Bacteriovoracaceae bacterium]
MNSLKLNSETWLDLTNMEKGVYSPVVKFMGKADYQSVVNNLRLDDGVVWPLPITLEIDEGQASNLNNGDLIELTSDDEKNIGTLKVEEIFKINDLKGDVLKLFGTDSQEHPGVKKELDKSLFRISGSVDLKLESPIVDDPNIMFPEDIKKKKKELGIESLSGFQTRNPPHRAHEHLQRVAMEVSDALLIHPITGWKKTGDFTPEAIVAAYTKMIRDFYPKDKVLFATLSVAMRYAGPREAMFHALIRRNYGCTHFVVGRDHAGVGDFYKKYEAQELCQS